MKYYGCDAHKKYCMFSYMDENGDHGPSLRVSNEKEHFINFLETLPPGSSIAIETVGNYYWMVDAMEKAGHKPKLANAGKAKSMMGQLNKTDKLDAEGLATLLRNGTLPEVWIPPGELRDKRELPRMRMTFVGIRTKLKNRIHSYLSKYAIEIKEVTDIFGSKGRKLLERRMEELPSQTKRSVRAHLELLDQVEAQIKSCEEQIKAVVKQTPEMTLLKTIPGVGDILAIVIALEVGDVSRFPRAQKLASYAGTVPRIKDSGGRRYYGRVRPDVNRYLKQALVEAANVVALNHKRWSDRHVSRLYQRIKHRRGGQKAIIAVARHVAEATYWMLKKNEPYKDPKQKETVSSTRK